MWLYFVTNQIAVFVSITRNRAVKLRRRTGARLFVFIRNAVDRLRESLVVDRRRTAARSVSRVVTEDRIVARIGLSINLRRLLRPRTFLGGKAGLLGGDARRRQAGDKDN